jgi:predicted Zn-dependent protease
MSNLGRVVILTAPSPDPSCLAGKGASIKKLFNTRDFLIGKPKEVAARFDRILIDDRNSNCAKFVANGGQAFEWPNAVKLTRLGKENGESVWDAMINDAIDFVCQVKRNSSKNFYFHCIPELKIAEK